MKPLKIGIVGAGTMGCTLAALITKAGFDVELAAIYKEQYALKQNNFIDVTGEFGDQTVIVKCCKGVEKFSSLKDYIFIMCRAHDVQKQLAIAKKYLAPNGIAVTPQNVITIYEELEVMPKEKLMPIIFGWSVIKLDVNHMNVTSSGINVLGPIAPDMEEHIANLKQVLGSFAPTYVTNNIMGLAISRLLINSCINSLGCITGARLGKLMEIRNVKKLFTGLFREGMQIAEARGIKITPYCKEFDYYELMKPGILPFIYRRRKLSQLGRQNPNVVSATLRNIENNRPHEADYISGFFVKEGKRLNIKTPLHSRLLEMIYDIENHEIGIFPENARDYYLRKPHKYIEKELNYVNRRN